jgi:hypothetical protein
LLVQGQLVLPYAARAAAHAADVLQRLLTISKFSQLGHASFVMKTPKGVIYNDPVGDVADYSDFPAPDLIVTTHEHGDHLVSSSYWLHAAIGVTRLIFVPVSGQYHY